MNVMSAAMECVSPERCTNGELRPPVAGVLLRGMGKEVNLSTGEARSLSTEFGAKWPEIARQLDDAAGEVDRFTRFDGPLGACDELEDQPGNYERARQMISALEQA